jgi:hypothetical protein
MDERSRTSGTFFVLATALFILLLSVPAEADIYRGCTGVLDMTVIGGAGVDKVTSKRLDHFEGRGQCNNTAQANTCRVRAKDNVFRCAKDFWAARWTLIGDPNDSHLDEGLPLSCQGRATGGKGIGPFRENRFGQFFDIKHAIEHAACCEVEPTASSLNVSISVSSSGDRGCGSNKGELGGYNERRTLESNYVVDCQGLRAQGMCAVRTGR